MRVDREDEIVALRKSNLENLWIAYQPADGLVSGEEAPIIDWSKGSSISAWCK